MTPSRVGRSGSEDPVERNGRLARVADVLRLYRDHTKGMPPTIYTRFRGAQGEVGRRDFATHWIHWYPAKMFHKIPSEIMASLTAKALTVLDPFCGSGTVLLEAALRGHSAIGIDVNPLARLISRVKTTRLDVASLSRRADQTLSRARASRGNQGVDVLPAYWFLPAARRALVLSHLEVQRVAYRPHRDFLRVCLSATVRQSSLADPSVAPPVRLSSAREKRASARYARDLRRAFNVSSRTVHDSFRKSVESNIARMSELCHCKNYGTARVLESAEAAATGLSAQSVDLIITSPPYCGAQKYVRSVRLEMLLLGFDHAEIAEIDRRTLGTERLSVKNVDGRLDTPLSEANMLIRRIAQRNTTRALMAAEYICYLTRFAMECYRVLKRGGDAFVTFGTGHVAGIPVAWDRLFRAAAKGAGLRIVAVLVDNIPSRGFMTARHQTSGTINDERVVWLRRD